MTKTCFKCLQEKSISEFYRQKGMKDGRLGKCKDCTKKDSTANRDKNVSYYRQYDRKRGNHSNYKERDPRKRAARILLRTALRAKRVNSMPCVVCGDHKSHAHHENYDRPLDVVWLCPVHHSERHKQMRREGIIP